jgi:RND family efflux transporter MFP subunit
MPHRVKEFTALAVLTFASMVGGCVRKNEYVAPPPPEVTVAQPVTEAVTDYLEFTGTTRAVAKVDLRARVSGYLKSIEFDDGANVEKGQLLFVIEREPFVHALASEKAKLKKAEAALSLAEAEVKRTEPLVRRGALSQQELDVKLANRTTAQADVGAAKAEVDEAEWNLNYTEITAPISGRIERHMVDVGNLVQSQTTLLTTIESIAPIYAYFTVSESEVLRFMESQRSNGAEQQEDESSLSLGLSEGDGFPFKGRLDYTELGVDPDTGTQQRRAVFPNKDHKLVPGLFARIHVPVGKPQPQLLVNERAIGADQRGTFVLVVNDKNVVEYRPVELGTAHEGKRVIKRGLSEGEWFVLNGLQRARPGAPVKPIKAENVAAHQPSNQEVIVAGKEGRNSKRSGVANSGG